MSERVLIAWWDDGTRIARLIAEHPAAEPAVEQVADAISGHCH